jgi:hypothetical protein
MIGRREFITLLGDAEALKETAPHTTRALAIRANPWKLSRISAPSELGEISRSLW